MHFRSLIFAVKRVVCVAILLVSIAASAQGNGSAPATPMTIDKNGRAHLGDLTYPFATYQPDPEYTDSAREAGIEGEVWVSFVVGTDGLPDKLKVVRPLPFGLTDKAVQAVKTWRFEPGTKNGKPVAVQLQTEVSFRLLHSTIGLVNLASSATGAGLDSYLGAATARISEQWTKREPKGLRTPVAKNGEVWIEFTIGKDGQAGNSQITVPSDDPALDEAARESIAAANPLGPLPPEFPGSKVTLRMQFLYRSGMEIAPSGVALEPGKTQQFSITVGSTTNPPANWTIEGPGCAGSACGTVSASGLYTAPAHAPPTSYLTVTATLTNTRRLTAQAHVVIGKQ